ncbi:MAG: hypothetical protein ACRD27_11325 [Terracidiphilus sp.]
MQWLVIGFLVSLGALLLAAAGVARHIRRHRVLPRQRPAAGLDAAARLGRETELETEP